MTKTARSNLVAAAVLAVLVASGTVLGIRGTVDAVYDAGYAAGSFMRQPFAVH